MSSQRVSNRLPSRGNPATKQRLIEDARALLSAHRGSGLRVADVTKAAGVSHGTFYVYFPSIEDLLDLIAESLADEIEISIRRAVGALTGAEAVIAIVQAFLPHYRDIARLAHNLDQATPKGAERRSASLLMQERLSRQITAVVEASHETRVVETDLVCWALAGMVQRSAETWFGDGIEAPVLNPEQAAQVLVPAIRGAISASVATTASGANPLLRGGPDDWITASASKSRNALVFGDREISYGDLMVRVDAARVWLDDLGLKAGTRLALLLHNGIAPIELTLAAWKQGIAVVPLDAFWQTTEIASVLTSSQPGAIAFDDETRGIVESLPTSLNSRLVRLATGRVGLEDRYESEIARRLGAEAPTPAPSVSGAIWYTSGTTDNPKGVAREEHTSERRRHARFMSSLVKVDGRSVFLLAGPIYYAANFVITFAVLAAGGTVVVMERFDAEEALRLIERWRVTNTLLVPTMLYRVLELPSEVRDSVDLDSLVAVVHTGAPCPVELKQRSLEYFGLRLYEWYATTEQGGTFIGPEEWVEHPGSVGKRWSPETQVRILDEEGNELPPDCVGVIALRDARRPPFSYVQADSAVQSLTDDGFFLTGDMGWLDDQGYLYLADRRNDRILTDGAILYPSEVEAVLNAQPSVRDSAVIGVEDAELGQRVVAYVVPTTDKLDTRRLAAAVQSRLAPYKCPREWHVVDSLPRNAAGKLRRRNLR